MVDADENQCPNGDAPVNLPEQGEAECKLAAAIAEDSSCSSDEAERGTYFEL